MFFWENESLKHWMVESGWLLISLEDALLDFPFQLVRIVGLVEHGLDSFLQWDLGEWRWIDADNQEKSLMFIR